MQEVQSVKMFWFLMPLSAKMSKSRGVRIVTLAIFYPFSTKRCQNAYTEFGERSPYYNLHTLTFRRDVSKKSEKDNYLNCMSSTGMDVGNWGKQEAVEIACRWFLLFEHDLQAVWI